MHTNLFRESERDTYEMKFLRPNTEYLVSMCECDAHPRYRECPSITAARGGGNLCCCVHTDADASQPTRQGADRVKVTALRASISCARVSPQNRTGSVSMELIPIDTRTCSICADGPVAASRPPTANTTHRCINEVLLLLRPPSFVAASSHSSAHTHTATQSIPNL